MSTLTSSAGSRDHAHSSAPVLEFVCLFTHDLRRKQKRWQDGRVKYHTFNKRVMVYDERGNFIGDMYWRRGWEFDEGEEIELERGGVIVQVAECVGRQNQDLSELIDKRAKEKEQRAAQRPVVPHVPMHTPLTVTRTPGAQRDHFQTRHRPLNQLLGTPTGHHGRALVPTESPYEQRHAADQTPDEESTSRAQKRRRPDDLPSSKMGYAQALFGAPLTLSGAPMSSAPIRRPALPRPQPRVDLTSSQEDGLSDSRPFGITGEPNRGLQRRSPGPEARTVQRVGEQPTRAPLAIANTNKPPVRRDTESHASDEDRIGQMTSRRGVSSHFGNASEESQKRASLLKTARQRMERTRDPLPIDTERRADKPRQVPVQRPRKPVEPEPITIPGGDEEDLFVQTDARDVEEEAPVTRSPIMEPSRQERDARESGKSKPREQQMPKRSSGTLFKSNSLAHSTTTDNESDAPEPVQAPKRTLPVEPVEPVPAPQPPIEPPQEERRTELRLKSRGRRGLLVLSEMAKEAPAKTRKKRRAPTPEPEPEPEPEAEELTRDSIEEIFDIPEDFLGEPGCVLVEARSPTPAFVNGRAKETACVEPESSDPFATQRPPSVRERAKLPPREVPTEDPDDSDPFATQEPVVRKRTEKSARKATSPDPSDPFATQQPTARKNARGDGAQETVEEEEPVMDIDGDNGLPTFDTSSPEPIQRTKRNSRNKPKPKHTVYEIPDDTDDEQISLRRPETSPPKPKKTTKPREWAKKKAKAQASEEDVDSEPEERPKGRATRTRKRKPEKAPQEESEEETRPENGKNKRARSALSFLDDQSSEGEEEDLPMPPPKVSKTTKASKAAKTTKAPKKKALRLGKKLKSTIKSREVFGFNSSPPPPPNFGFGAVAATNTFNRPAPVIEEQDPPAEIRPDPVVSKPPGRAKPNPNTDEVPAKDTTSRANLTHFFHRRTSVPDVQPPKDPEPAKTAASMVQSAHGKRNHQGFGAVDARPETAVTTAGTRGNATVQSNDPIRDNQTNASCHPQATASGAAKDSGVRPPEQSVISRIEHEEKAVGHSGRSGLHTASHNNAPAPGLPPVPQEQAITANARPEKSLPDVQKGPIIPPAAVPPIAAPSHPPKDHTKPPAPVRPPPGPVAPTVAVTASGVAVSIGSRKEDTAVPLAPVLPQIQTKTQAPVQARARPPPVPVIPPPPAAVAVGTSGAGASTTAGISDARKTPAPAPPQIQAQPRPPPGPAAALGVTTTTVGKVAAPPIPPATTTAPAPATTAPSVTTPTPAAATATATATATANIPVPAAVAAPMGPPARIPNPASRGRKAALKSDAAGQTPQSILPPAEPLADRSNLLRRSNTHPAGAAGGQQAERPRLKMTFPGFVSAREHDGGPWSREAHDLLGGGRPGD